MALLTVPTGEAAATRRQRRALRSWAEHASMLFAAAVWILVMTRNSGGHEGWSLTGGALSLLPALGFVRPRIVGRGVALAVGGSILGGIVALSLTAPGWSNATWFGDQAYGLLVFLVALNYATTSGRRLALAATVMAAGVWEFGLALVPWWGHQDPSVMMLGTFYWHNQFGAYMLGTGLVGAGSYVLGRSRIRLAGLIVAAISAVGIWLSVSRANIVIFAAGWLALGLFAWRSEHRRGALIRWALIPALAFGLLSLLVSPLLFPHAAYHVGSSAVGKSSVNSLGTDGGARIVFTKAALLAWLHSPLIGNGFGSFFALSVNHAPLGYQLSPYVHDAYAEALVSGGVIFAAPALLGLLYLGRRFLAVLRDRRPAGAVEERALRLTATIAAIALLGHSAFDFDWHYPALAALAGVIAALACSGDRANRVKVPAPRPAEAPAWRWSTAALGTVAVVGVAAIALGQLHTQGNLLHGKNPLLTTARSLADKLPDPTAAVTTVQEALRYTPTGMVLDVSRSRAESALAGTARLGAQDPKLDMARALVMVALGEDRAGLRLAETLVRADGAHRPYLRGALALALAATGQKNQARRMASSEAAAMLAVHQPGYAQDLALALWQIDGQRVDGSNACLLERVNRAAPLPGNISTALTGALLASCPAGTGATGT